MKKIFAILSALYVFGAVSLAETAETLDVFEEFAATENELSAESFNITTEKNKSVQSALKYRSDIKTLIFEIAIVPKAGSVEITDYKGGFVYTPNRDYVGEDSFGFRISSGGESSNIAYCNITIGDSSGDEVGFSYEDMRDHWANFSAVKLVERDVIKGERIGKRYFFYPEIEMRRIDVVEFILSALNIDFDGIDKNKTHIFGDSAVLPDYINEAAYLANKSGIIDGVRDGEFVYFRPYEYITRAELIKMIDSAMGGKTQNGDEIKFDDEGNIPDWAAQSVKNLVGYGIVKGFEDNTLRPYDKITKAQTAEMIYQMIKYNEKNSFQTVSERIIESLYGNYMV